MSDAYENQLIALGLKHVKVEDKKHFCDTCKDLGTYEMFYFQGREHPIIGYDKVIRVMPKDWRTLEHYSEAHRCPKCFGQFKDQHKDLVDKIETETNAGYKEEHKLKLRKLWGRST